MDFEEFARRGRAAQRAVDALTTAVHPDRFIVAEISKNWIDGREVAPGSGLLAQQFERVIAHNHARGYWLLQFQLHRLLTAPDELNETIIAVFERREEPAAHA